MSLLTPDFTRTLEQVQNERLVLKPLVERYLAQAKFPDEFFVSFRKAGRARKPDGFFHPSTHPLWPARMLYYYLTQPDAMEEEILSYESRMYVTMGTAVGAFVQMAIRDAGYMLPLPKGECPVCLRKKGLRPGQCDEHAVLDASVPSRGHVDGIINVPLDGKHWKANLPGLFEFKTMNSRKGGRVQNNDLDWFIEKCPDYYAQVQEYMLLLGLTQCLVLICNLDERWRLVEIQVPFDHIAAAKTREKYALVNHHKNLLAPPDPCCAIGSKTAKSCAARFVCPVGMVR